MVIIEIALLPLQHGKIPDDPDSAAGQVHASALETVLSQPGLRRVRWGRQVEDSLLLIWLVDWDSVECHKKFMASTAYEPFLGQLGEILDIGARAYHVGFNPCGKTGAPSDSRSTNTQIITMWFPVAYSQQDQDEVANNAKRFAALLENQAKSYNASSGGWVEETIDIPGTLEKGSAYVLLVQWDLPKASREAQETDAFKSNVHLLRNAKDLQKLEIVHSSLVEATRDTKHDNDRANL